MGKRIFSALALALFAVGCATMTKSEITNITPSFYNRSTNHLYSVTAAFNTRQATIRKDTVQGYVVLGNTAHKMQKTPLVPNRWETNVTVPEGQTNVVYRIRFDYEYNAIPQRKTGSILSPSYELRIRDKK